MLHTVVTLFITRPLQAIIIHGVFSIWEEVYLGLVILCGSIGIVNIFNIALDNDYFDNPTGHAYWGVKYWLGIVAVSAVCWSLLVNALGSTKKRRDNFTEYKQKQNFLSGKSEDFIENYFTTLQIKEEKHEKIKKTYSKGVTKIPEESKAESKLESLEEGEEQKVSVKKKTGLGVPNGIG